MLRTIILVTALASLPLAAEAQSYRCVGKDGKKYYGQSVPPQCAGQPIEQLNEQGLVVKKIDAQATADERAKKEADDVERKKREAVSKEEGRRDRALIATYTSEKDVLAIDRSRTSFIVRILAMGKVGSTLQIASRAWFRNACVPTRSLRTAIFT